MRSLRRALRICFVSLLLAIAPFGTAPAQTVPESTQLPIFLKLLTYDRTLWDKPEPRLRIGVLHRFGDEKSQENLAAITEALSASAGKTVNDVSYDFTTIGWNTTADLERVLREADVDVLYVTAGHARSLATVEALARERGLLTLAGNEQMVADGLAVGIGLENDRPQIIVNLGAVDAEGHEFDSRVLRLCKVVGR